MSEQAYPHGRTKQGYGAYPSLVEMMNMKTESEQTYPHGRWTPMPTIAPLNWQPAQSMRAQQVKEEIAKEIAALKARGDYYTRLADQAYLQAQNLQKMTEV